MTHDFLILPGSLAWEVAVQEIPPPPGWEHQVSRLGGDAALIGNIGNHGLLDVVDLNRYQEFIHDGELEARQDEIEIGQEVFL